MFKYELPVEEISLLSLDKPYWWDLAAIFFLSVRVLLAVCSHYVKLIGGGSSFCGSSRPRLFNISVVTN